MLTATLNNGIIKTETVSMPEPKENENLVRMEYCGICGTDFQKYLNFPSAAEWGHEIIGRLSDARGDVFGRVIIRTSFPCGECKACLKQRYFECLNWKRVLMNGFSEYIVVDKRCVLPVNPKSDMLEYALTEPLNVAINLVNRVSPDKDDVFAIIGNGTIGLLTVFYLWLTGCGNISLYARKIDGVRLQFAESLGVKTYSYNETIKNDIRKANKIINTAPYETMPVIMEYASPYTVITFNGINKNSLVTLDMANWHFKNLTVSPSFPHPQNDFSEAIKVVEAHGKKLKMMVTHVFSLDETPNAFELMKSKEIDYIKVLIKGSTNDTVTYCGGKGK